MKTSFTIIGLVVLFSGGVFSSGGAWARILPPTEGYTIEVGFSEGLERRMTSINNVEQRLEERFRRNRHDAYSSRQAGTQRFAKNRTAGTEWAGERLIGEVSDFTLPNLVKAMLAYNINRAVPDFAGQIEIQVTRLKLSNPPTAFLESFQSYVIGHIKVTDPDGSVLFDDKVTANLVVDTTVDTSYDGPELAFVETDPSKRVGPTLAYFVKRALQQAWPEHEDDFVGPTIVRISGPNERVILD